MKTKLLSLFLVPFFLLVGCGKDGTTGTAPAVAAKPITDIRDITQAPDRRVHVGKKVEIVSASVEGRPHNYIFLVGDKNHKVPVVRLDKLKGPVTKHVKNGSIANITGTVRLLSEVPANDPMWDNGKVNAADRAAILTEFVYIAADSVDVIHNAE